MDDGLILVRFLRECKVVSYDCSHQRLFRPSAFGLEPGKRRATRPGRGDVQGRSAFIGPQLLLDKYPQPP